MIESTLKWLERQTNLRTKQSRMLSNGEQGRFLQEFSKELRPENILELGTFTGYSAICLSVGATGVLDTIEIFDELEDLIREGIKRSDLESKIFLHIGDAKDIIPRLPGDRKYDLIYIDANKREYITYYNLVFDKLNRGGYIIADNVLWSGKVNMENPPKDAQTQALIAFNKMVEEDDRVENYILPMRDGMNIIKKI